MRILVGYDGSNCSKMAIEELKRAGLPRTSKVLVLCAADVFLPQGKEVGIPRAIQGTIAKARAEAKEKLAQAKRLAVQAQTQIRSMFPGWSVQAEACADSPAWALVKKSESWKADLIVLGAYGHSKLGRFLGSVSQMVLTQAPCSVRIARPSFSIKNKKLRIFIGLDGSADASAALAMVAERVWPRQTEFMLTSVIDPSKSSFMEYLAPSAIQWLIQQADNERKAVDHMLEAYAEKLRVSGAVVTCKVKKGDPKMVLVREAEAWRADCIFMGARGLTHLKRFFMGGVSTAVSARSHCSVEVIRPRDR